MNGTNRGEYELMSTHIKETMHNNFGMTLSGKVFYFLFFEMFCPASHFLSGS